MTPPSSDAVWPANSRPECEAVRDARHGQAISGLATPRGIPTSGRPDNAARPPRGDTTPSLVRRESCPSPKAIQPAGIPKTGSTSRNRSLSFPSSSHPKHTRSPASCPPIGIAETTPRGRTTSRNRYLGGSPCVAQPALRGLATDPPRKVVQRCGPATIVAHSGACEMQSVPS